MRVLLAEDELTLGIWLCKALERLGIQVEWLNDGKLADVALRGGSHDVLILDLGLPGLSGEELLVRLRARDQRLPILVLTARNSSSDKVRLLNLGADDFLAKPFDLPELEARLQALVRRARGNEHPRMGCGDLLLDGVKKQFLLQGKPLILTPREHAVLQVLIQHSGEPMSKRQIMERVFTDDQDVHPEAIEVLVHRLRKRLDISGVRITTMRGLGYVLEEI